MSARPTALTKLNTDSREQNQVQSNTEQALAPLVRNPLNNGVLLRDVVLAVGNNIIEHKMLRKPLGYIITSQSGVSNFYDNLSLDVETKLNFNLNSSAAVTVSLWVF